MITEMGIIFIYKYYYLFFRFRFSFFIFFRCHFHLIWPFFFQRLLLLFIYYPPNQNAPAGIRTRVMWTKTTYAWPDYTTGACNK